MAKVLDNGAYSVLLSPYNNTAQIFYLLASMEIDINTALYCEYISVMH